MIGGGGGTATRDNLPSWNDGAAKTAIIDFLAQGFFLVDRGKPLAAKDPALRERQRSKALLERGMKTLDGMLAFANTDIGELIEGFIYTSAG